MIEKFIDELFDVTTVLITTSLKLFYFIIKYIIKFFFSFVYDLTNIIFTLFQNYLMEIVIFSLIFLICYIRYNNKNNLEYIIKQVKRIEERQLNAKINEKKLTDSENILLMQMKSRMTSRRIIRITAEKQLIQKEAKFIDSLCDKYRLNNITQDLFECPICRIDKLSIEFKTLKCHSTHKFCRSCIIRIDKCPLCSSVIM